MVLCNDDHLDQRLRELKDQGRPVRGTGGDDDHPTLGFNFKLTNLQACVGLAQLECLRERMDRMKRRHQIYQESLKDIEQIRLLPFDLEAGELPLWTDALVEDRDGLDRFLTSKGIHPRRFWFPVHTHPPYRLPDQGFPITNTCSRRALWLPSAFTLTDNEVERVCETIRRYFMK